jgi:hypothetical protein
MENWGKVNRMKKKTKEKPKKASEVLREPSDYWKDTYTDANGNCFSDADPGL